MNNYSTSWWSLLLISRPREDERLSWPCWLTVNSGSGNRALALFTSMNCFDMLNREVHAWCLKKRCVTNNNNNNNNTQHAHLLSSCRGNSRHMERLGHRTRLGDWPTHHSHHWRCQGNSISVPAPVHGPSTGERGRLPKHNVHRMSRRFSH